MNSSEKIKIINITTEFITLSQFLKFMNFIDNGGMAKNFMEQNRILINNVLAFEKRKKIFPKDQVNINNKYIFIIERGTNE